MVYVDGKRSPDRELGPFARARRPAMKRRGFTKRITAGRQCPQHRHEQRCQRWRWRRGQGSRLHRRALPTRLSPSMCCGSHPNRSAMAARTSSRRIHDEPAYNETAAFRPPLRLGTRGGKSIGRLAVGWPGANLALVKANRVPTQPALILLVFLRDTVRPRQQLRLFFENLPTVARDAGCASQCPTTGAVAARSAGPAQPRETRAHRTPPRSTQVRGRLEPGGPR